jgi:hypothetical protein
MPGSPLEGRARPRLFLRRRVQGSLQSRLGSRRRFFEHAAQDHLLVFGMSSYVGQRLKTGLLSRIQCLLGFLSERHQQPLVHRAGLGRQGFNLAQPTIRPGQVNARLEFGGERRR